MEYDVLENKLMSMKAAARDYPFGPEAAVFKVGGKMFALVAWREAPIRITLKCNPAEAEFLRSSYESVKPGYYMNKNHWNTISLDGSIPEELIHKMIDSSYALVIKGLPKSDRERLK